MYKLNIFKFFSAHIGTRLVSLTILSLFVSFVEGIGLLSLSPLIDLILENNVSEKNYFILTPMLNILGLDNTVISIMSIILIMFTIKGSLNYLYLAQSAEVKADLSKKLRNKLISNYISLNFKVSLKTTSGGLSNIITEQVSRVLRAFDFLSRFYAGILASIILMGFGLVVSPHFFLFSILLFLIFGLIYQNLISKTKNISILATKESKELAENVIRCSDGIKYLLSTSNLNLVQSSLTKSINKIANLEQDAGKLAAVSIAIKDPLSITTMMILVFFQLTFFELEASIFVVNLLLMHRLINTILQTSSGFQLMNEFSGSVHKIDSELYSCDHENIDKFIRFKKIPDKFDFDIELKDVSFSHDKKRKIFKNLDLKIPFGNKVLLTGQSGSGKSTILDLITGLIQPDSGSVIVGGENIKKINIEYWRQQLGVVLQEPTIFSGTLIYNVTLRTSEELSKEEILKVEKLLLNLGLDQFISKLPYGLNTVISDKGLNMSGGQRQRIGLAREIFKRPKCLFVDEATSALDSKNEINVWKVLENLDFPHTLILISHTNPKSHIKFDHKMDIGSLI